MGLHNLCFCCWCNCWMVVILNICSKCNKIIKKREIVRKSEMGQDLCEDCFLQEIC